MPNSFSRFLSDEELQRVRAIYEDSLAKPQPQTEQAEADESQSGPRSDEPTE